MNTHINQQVDRPAPEGEKSKTPNREDKAILTPVGDVQYGVNISIKLLYKIRLHEDTSTTVPRFALNK